MERRVCSAAACSRRSQMLEVQAASPLQEFLHHWGSDISKETAGAAPCPNSLLYTSWVTANAHERAFYEGGSFLCRLRAAALGAGARNDSSCLHAVFWLCSRHCIIISPPSASLRGGCSLPHRFTSKPVAHSLPQAWPPCCPALWCTWRSARRSSSWVRKGKAMWLLLLLCCCCCGGGKCWAGCPAGHLSWPLLVQGRCHPEHIPRCPAAGSPHPAYQAWIDKYGGPEFEGAVLQASQGGGAGVVQ